MKHDHIEIYKSRNGQFGWRYRAKNGRRIACGGETFHNRKDAVDICKRLFAAQLASGDAMIIETTK